MAQITPVSEQSFCQLVYHLEISEIASRVTEAVSTLFNYLLTSLQAIAFEWQLWFLDPELSALLQDDQGVFGSLSMILDAIYEIPSYQRLSVVQAAKPLMTKEMTLANRKSVLQLFSGKFEDDIKRFSEFSELAARPFSDPEQKVRVYNAVNALSDDRIRMHLNAPQAVGNQGDVGDTDYGVNVHVGNRERQTELAIERLRIHQTGVADYEIAQAYNSFVNYLDNTTDIPDAMKQDARHVLLDPNGNHWGPLIAPGGFNIYNMHVDGKTLIGRLYLFAMSFSGVERDNALRGIVAGLADGMDQGYRVCNPGKTQRVVISVIQGRLAGVNIDAVEIPVQIPTNQAMNLFFAVEAHRNISDYTELTNVANNYCNDNPAVIRAEFIAEMTAYAVLMGMIEEPAS